MQIHNQSLQQWLLLPLLLLASPGFARVRCNSYSPAFPLPQYDPNSEIIQQARRDIEARVKELLKTSVGFNTTSYSIAVTSSKETLFDIHHTTVEQDEDRPGAPVVNGDTCYRVASVTKTFTSLALLLQDKAGSLSLDDPINKYVSSLNEAQNGTLPWKDITLRALAAQLSGIPRDLGQDDLLRGLGPDDPTTIGLPPLAPSQHHESACDSLSGYVRSCTTHDILDYLKDHDPIFPPKQTSTYSNMNFDLLGMALSNITSTPYETLIQDTILTPLNLTSTTFTSPPDHTSALLPHNASYFYDMDLAGQNPTAGLFSSSNDLAKYLRYTLSTYNGITPSLNWFQPGSYATGTKSFYGLPWEIFRTDTLLPYTDRPTSFVAKAGNLPSYSSVVVNMPEYDLGFVILIAGDGTIRLEVFRAISEILVGVGEELARRDLVRKYTGTYSYVSTSPPPSSSSAAAAAAAAAASTTTTAKLNSSISLSHTLSSGLYITNWISNGTDVLSPSVLSRLHISGLAGNPPDSIFSLQLVPTLLYKNQAEQKGEIWRMLAHAVIDDQKPRLWIEDYCPTDLDLGNYGGVSVGEVVFWPGEGGERGDDSVRRLELSGFRVVLEKDLERKDGKEQQQEEEEEEERLIVQV